MKPELRKSKAGSRTISIIAAAIVILAGLSVLLVLWQRHSAFLILWQRHSASVEGQARATLHLESNSFVSGGAIPRRYTCDGSNDSPGLQWAGAPAGTKSFALVMSDPDAPIDFTHWLAYNIPPGFRGLAEGASGHSVMPQGSAEGTNNFGRLGYGGPCPPAGKPHHYIFRLFALDVRLDLPPGATRDQVESAIGGHVLAEGEIMGFYRRPSQ